MARTFVTFARFNVFDGEDYVAVRPVQTDEGFVGRTRIGSLIPLQRSTLAITANDAGSIGFADRKGNAYRIPAAKVRNPETLAQLLRRNPWDNVNARIMLRGLTK